MGNNGGRVIFYPASQEEALALLYLEQQDNSGISPEAFYDKYIDSLSRIKAHSTDLNAKEKAEKTPYQPVIYT